MVLEQCTRDLIKTLPAQKSKKCGQHELTTIPRASARNKELQTPSKMSNRQKYISIYIYIPKML